MMRLYFHVDSSILVSISLFTFQKCMTQDKMLTLTKAFNFSFNLRQYDFIPNRWCWRQTGTPITSPQTPPSSSPPVCVPTPLKAPVSVRICYPESCGFKTF